MEQNMGKEKFTDKELLDLEEENFSVQEIAEKLLVSESAIQRRRKKLGLKKNIVGPKCKVDKNEIKRLYLEENLGYALIADRVGLAQRTVAHHLRDVPKNSDAKNYKTGPIPLYSDEEIKHLYEVEGLTSAQIAEKGILSKKGVGHALHRADIKVRPKGTTINTLVDAEFFNPDNITAESIYWVGFIFGDGSINDTRLVLALKSTDDYHIKKFNEKLNAISLKYREKTLNDKTYKQVRTTISNKTLIEHLNNYGILPNKTYVGGAPKNIPKEYLNSFALGILDADGWVGYSKGKYSIGWCGHIDHISFIRDSLISELDISLNICKHVNIYRIQTSAKSNIKKMSEWLLSNNDYSLLRKRERLLNILQEA
jgi:DNA-binding Lrp family transcriptional regulator